MLSPLLMVLISGFVHSVHKSSAQVIHRHVRELTSPQIGLSVNCLCGVRHQQNLQSMLKNWYYYDLSYQHGIVLFIMSFCLITAYELEVHV